MHELPLAHDTQRLIAESFFGSRQCSQLQPYFRYCSGQYKQISTVASMNSYPFMLGGHEDLLQINSDIKRRISFDEIVERLVSKHSERNYKTREPFDYAINLTLRMLLMIDVGAFHNSFSGREPILWNYGTIDDFVRTLAVCNGQPQIPCEGLKLESQFNGKNLERIGGFHVQLTTNLADHLLIREEMSVVMIFHHASFLEHHQG
jgi:hypothetical protein